MSVIIAKYFGIVRKPVWKWMAAKNATKVKSYDRKGFRDMTVTVTAQ